LSLFFPVDAKLGVSVAYIKSQLGIATLMYFTKANVTCAKIKIRFLLNDFSLVLIKVTVTVAKKRKSSLLTIP